jgi:branched-chain amino acid transport system substrate-binding protein
MSASIGILLPRSGEYPSMAFDLLDGLRLNLKRLGVDAQVHTENIGFGEDVEITHAAAEKLVLNHDVQLIIAYATSLNAEALYPFAQVSGKPFLFIDAGMEVFEAKPHPLCHHITLQGLLACRLLGEQASRVAPKVYASASFFDGGYRGSWAFQEGVEKNGGSIVGHFVSHYQPAEFRLDSFEQQLQQSEARSVTAAFSSYFVELFMNHLKNTAEATRTIPIFCAPFMADEQLLPSIPFPGATLNTIVPWATSLDSAENKVLMETLKTGKNKTANLFHLLGWEAAFAVQRVISENNSSTLNGWSFDGPRGVVTFHPETNSSYAPLYEGVIGPAADGNCQLTITGTIEVSADLHREMHFAKPVGEYSRWKNNFFCI